MSIELFFFFPAVIIKKGVPRLIGRKSKLRVIHVYLSGPFVRVVMRCSTPFVMKKGFDKMQYNLFVSSPNTHYWSSNSLATEIGCPG